MSAHAAKQLPWTELRSWNGSQQSAFEELCCQLAAYEVVPSGSVFKRKKAPDAGVECYWTLPNGDEWGWQAKFFTSAPEASQWKQIDESIDTALNKHPKLTAYVVCLAADRQDPRSLDGGGRAQHWFMDEWNSRVEKWARRASEKQMSVEFRFWGQHELFERLSREEHHGRLRFWFDKEFLGDQWLRHRLDEAIANAGPRYTPELNVELPLSQLFDGLGRTAAFKTRIRTVFGHVRRALLRATTPFGAQVAPAEHAAFSSRGHDLLSLAGALPLDSVEPLGAGPLVTVANEVRVCAWDFARALEKRAEERARAAQAKGVADSTAGKHRDWGESVRSLAESIRGVTGELHDLTELLNETGTALATVPALLLRGTAGTGKTHLFCDVARTRMASGAPTLLVLGQQLQAGEPWTAILEVLGLRCTREEFLGALETVAVARGQRALVLIDALNEGAARDTWSQHLAGFAALLARYPWVGVAFSVRSTYEAVVVPDHIPQDRLIRATHYGFAGHEYKATRTFFEFYGIMRPSVPLLSPEFENPLFLKLVCKGLKDRRMTEIPKGFHGVTTVFDFFLESINERLSDRKKLDFDRSAPMVRRAAEALSEAMSKRWPCQWLPRNEAADLVNAVLPRQGFENSFFRHLMDEGLLSEDRFYLEDGWADGVRFAYERMADHLVTRRLLDVHLDPRYPANAFRTDQPLGFLLADESACRTSQGLIEALSVQLPERVGNELSELAPQAADWEAIKESFVQSLIWRMPDATTDATLQYVNTHIVPDSVAHTEFLRALLTVSANPEHSFNADFLHKHLAKQAMPDRDAWWSVFLFEEYGNLGAVDRLIDWAWSSDTKDHISDESVRLAATTLVWFLTTSHRFVRDRATKALVSLLTPRPIVLRQIIGQFSGVNDPYILERVFAVAYGCAMRNREPEVVRSLAIEVYQQVFEQAPPPPDVLLRDYARGVIELAVAIGVATNIALDRVRPPYRSEWSANAPSEEALKPLGEWREKMPEDEWARVHLYQSVMGHEDFARYVIGTNLGRSAWSNQRLADTRVPTRKQTYEKFRQGLSARLRGELDRHAGVLRGVSFCRRLEPERQREHFKRTFTEAELDQVEEESAARLRNLLGKKRRGILDSAVLEYLANPHQDEHAFDLKLAQRWLLQRVLDLGWSAERFGPFDREVARSRASESRAAHKPERIGKKYQWIAWHELLARLADNFVFRGEGGDHEESEYQGPWQLLGVRDIDPSCLASRTKADVWTPRGRTWWTPTVYATWSEGEREDEWVRRSEDLPRFEQFLEVTRPDGSCWLPMEMHCHWEQPTPPEEDRYHTRRRQLWYSIHAYLVRRPEADVLFDWALRQNFMGRWMPECARFHEVFLGEVHWSPALASIRNPYYGLVDWQRPERLPAEVLVPSVTYSSESEGFDCSVEDTFTLHVPSPWIAERMKLSWRGREGEYHDPSGRLVALDPSVKEHGSGALLMEREAFLGFLDANNLDVIWTVLGEKQVMPGDFLPQRRLWLEVNGAYRLKNGEPTGRLNVTFEESELP